MRPWTATPSRMRTMWHTAAGCAFRRESRPGIMPGRADRVAMKEDVRVHEEDGAPHVMVPGGLKRGANRRKAGEDLAEGALMLEPGRRLRPQDMAALASIGRTHARCFERLRVALLSTGDEIVRPGAPLGPGQVYDANHYLLAALLDALGAEVTDLGIAPDREDAVAGLLGQAAASHHAVITSGGASRGEEDYVVRILEHMGRR